MNISYLKKWIEEFPLLNLNFKNFYYNEIFVLEFKENHSSIAIINSNYDNYCFYVNEKSNINIGKIFNDDDNNKNQPFCKNINFYLNHSVLSNCELINEDKIIKLTFNKWNIYNKKETFFLIFELIQRFQNLIFGKKEDDKLIILDSLKKITFADQSTRQILPGTEYCLPITKYIQINENVLYPLIIDNKQFNSINDYFIYIFYSIELKNKIEVTKKQIIKNIEKEKQKNEKKFLKQKNELKNASDIKTWYQISELLKSELNNIKTGMSTITLKNYFEDGFPDIIVSLDSKLSPQKNLALYLKKYRKAKNGLEIISQNILKTEKEIIHLNDYIAEISNIFDYNILKQFNKNTLEKISVKKEKKLFRSIKIAEEWEILIGRSSTENDILTCSVAKPNDWWFHCRIFHGTHVVLRNFKKLLPPENILLLCSQLAAYYSSAKNSINVPVDYTQIRYVRKPRTAAKGFVIYTNQRTLYVTPISFREAVKLLDSIIV